MKNQQLQTYIEFIYYCISDFIKQTKVNSSTHPFIFTFKLQQKPNRYSCYVTQAEFGFYMRNLKCFCQNCHKQHYSMKNYKIQYKNTESDN